MSENLEKKTRRSALSRLLNMPPIIDIDGLARGGIERGTARVLLSNWTKKGLVEPVGERNGAYYNLVVDPEGRKTRLGQAVLREFSVPVVIGATALHAHGWTTQMAHEMEVAVPVTRNRRRTPNIEGVKIVPRSLTWYKRIADHVKREGYSGLALLDPEYALADAYKYQDVWVPDPDDIDIEEASERSLANLKTALDELKVSDDDVEKLLDYFGLSSKSPSPK